MSRLVTFTLDDARYGVDVLRVREVLRTPLGPPVPLAPEDVVGLLGLRGRVVPVVDPRVPLGLPARPHAAEGPDAADATLVVVHVHDEDVALVVDALGDVVEVDEDTFAPAPETLDAAVRALVPGAHVLPDGLLNVLDLDATVAA
ncbi:MULTISPECIES: chemotaxis protein CheW [Cellulomonas]|uniref:chemotaxis protein CheW n=1 Tax=Cellulomonas TaxID=1707 RepID=UPI0010A7C041|nr:MULTISPECIES: chemotaxis protein CheW [Cellulomonas]